MREIVGELFSFNKDGPAAICLTTNGWTKKDGSCVMGRGCAGQARERWPGIEFSLGEALKGGNVPHVLTQPADYPNEQQLILPTPGRYFMVPYHVVSFPVKPISCQYRDLLPRFQKQQPQHQPYYPGWMSKARLDLIRLSAERLERLAGERGWASVILPRCEVGAGGLQWSQVKPVLAEILGDKFYLINFPKR